ncbi:MAG: glycosyltransferase family 4 protein [Vicinamibacteria bacterium]|nr:glycosyltransferase family 4 protein [Vicinamibacteria bacterium]
MKVALDVRPALSRPTGVGVYIGALAAAIPRLDLESSFTLFTSSLSERWTKPVSDPNVEIVDRSIPVRMLNLAWNRLSWPPIEMLCGRAFDLVHSPHALLTPARRARRIISIHDLFFFKHPEMTGAEIRRDYAPLVQSHAAKADGIICPSEHTAREIETLLHVPTAKICVTPYGVDPAFRVAPTPADVEAVLQRLGLSRGGILYLGSDEKRKNLGALVNAYRVLAERLDDPPPLVLVGPGDAFDESPGPSGPRIVSTGYLETREVRALMAASQCLALVSLDEGFGFPVVEAMAAGLPVVCSRGSSLEEIAGGAAELVGDPRDKEAIVEGLSRVIEDPARAGELRTAGLERSRLFDWERTAEMTLGFYRKVLGS